MMKFEIKNRWSGDVQFTAEIECADNARVAIKVGLAVKWAIETRADLSEANLSRADLSGANLSGADLSEANLSRANLSGANLSGANLSRANLPGADLSRANLPGADLSGADLSRADLSRADLPGADLPGANLSGANNATLAFAQTLITPDGDLIGWKKLMGGVICKLRIPAEAKRHNASGRKCRAEFAVVLEGEGVSQHDNTFHYRVGETVRPSEPFNEDRWEECASGIHFYLTKIEAENPK